MKCLQEADGSCRFSGKEHEEMGMFCHLCHSKEVLYHVTGSGIMWSGEGREFPSSTDAIEVTEVIGIGLHSLGDSP